MKRAGAAVIQRKVPMFDFEESLKLISEQTIICVGDLMLDDFVYGEVSRISPEAPAPILAVTRNDLSVGGAGNVARNIAALGARCIFLGVVGEDEAPGRALADPDVGLQVALVRHPRDAELRVLLTAAARDPVLRQRVADARALPADRHPGRILDAVVQEVGAVDRAVAGDAEGVAGAHKPEAASRPMTTDVRRNPMELSTHR